MSHENDRRIAWEYEKTYYQIYATTDLLDGALDPLFIEAHRSAQNDADVQSIVDALNRIASHRDWILRGEAAVEGVEGNRLHSR